jgi:hypothetical protein
MTNKRIYSFSDKNGVRGVSGSLVYNAKLDRIPSMTDAEREAHAEKVEKMFMGGAQGTFLQLSATGGWVSAREFIIIKKPRRPKKGYM